MGETNFSISRRSVLKGVGAVPLATVLATPALTKASAAATTDVSLETADGRTVSASLALPDVTPAPAVILIHEWWGLNDQIKTMAVELAKEGFVALAVDMYGVPATDDPAKARELVGAVVHEEGIDTINSWAGWLRGDDLTNGKVAAMGWCFGGGWALEAAIHSEVDSAIIYYGRVDQPVEKLSEIDGPVLGHFATEDAFIDKPMVEGFEAGMAEAGKELTVHWYEADHAFANPTSARYDDQDAALAWARTLAFLKETIG
ncbi:MAG: dienelactone hydrolase family protein [Alphaproteobacteria bacterium]